MSGRKKTRDREIVLYGENYHYRGTPPGFKNRIERSLNTNDFDEARRNKITLLDRLDRTDSGVKKKRLGHLLWLEKDPATQKDILCGEYYQERLEEFKAKELRQRTIDETESILRVHIIPFFGKYPVAEIDEDLFVRYQKAKGKRDFSNHRKVLTHFLKWCKRQKYIRYVPDFEFVRKVVRRQRLILTDDEIKSFFEHAEGRLLIFICMYLFMGMRETEIASLERDRINFDEMFIDLAPEVVKTKQGRVIPLNPYTGKLLKKFLATHDSKYVFPSYKKKGAKVPYMSGKSFLRAFLALRDRIGIERDITPHDMRATWKKHAHKSTKFTDTQKEKMAGSSIDVQKRTYVSMDADDLRGLERVVEVDGLDKILSKKTISGGENGGVRS